MNADVDTPAHADLIAWFAEIETASRRIPTVGYAILTRLDREADPKALGATSLWKLIARRCRISKGDAQRRIKWARKLAPRRTLHGEKLAPEWEHTAAALADGQIGDDHVELIRKFFKALPGGVDPATRAQAEQTLADVARRLGPNELAVAAARLLALLHPDGELSDNDAARKVGLTLGRQQADGTSYLSGWISPTLRALLEPVIAKFAERTRRRPAAETAEPVLFDDPAGGDYPAGGDDTAGGDGSVGDQADDTAPTDDGVPLASLDPDGPRPSEPGPLVDHRWRTRAQHTHDAVAAGLELLLRSKTLGTLNGLPTTIVVTTTLAELERGAGYAVTAGGTRIPMHHLIELAARGAYHYLAVFDGRTGETLHLGRAQRCATGAQKLALFGRERGCSCPGCDVPFYETQAHHGVADWKHDGETDVDDLTLACGPDNRMIETTEWRTRRRPDGRFEWIPPPHLDYGQPRTNDTHHPERLLNPPEDDDEPL